MNYRNAQYNVYGTINCEIDHPKLGWIPFTASPDDMEKHGRDIYTQILQTGDVAEYVAPVVSNEELILKYREKVNRWRDEQEIAGVIHNTHNWDTTPQSREKISTAILGFQAGIPIPEGFYWTSADDVNVPVSDLSELVGILGAIIQRGNEIHQEQRTAKGLIENAADEAEMITIVNELGQ